MHSGHVIKMRASLWELVTSNLVAFCRAQKVVPLRGDAAWHTPISAEGGQETAVLSPAIPPPQIPDLSPFFPARGLRGASRPVGQSGPPPQRLPPPPVATRSRRPHPLCRFAGSPAALPPWTWWPLFRRAVGAKGVLRTLVASSRALPAPSSSEPTRGILVLVGAIDLLACRTECIGAATTLASVRAR